MKIRTFFYIYKYKYNGKELQDELGLNVTAMDFRMYDNAIGRFHSIDKMTDIMPSLSPYRFAFNNPVLWNDPTGLLEGKGDPTPYIPLKGVTVTGKAKSKQPASFNYSLIPRSAMNDSRRPTMAQYNKANNTNYSSFKDYYNHEHYQPALKAQTQSIHDATGNAAKICAVVAGTLTGTAYLAPFIAAASPVIESKIAVLITNPAVQHAGIRMGFDAGTQYAAKGSVDIADVAITGAIPTVGGKPILLAFKPIFQASVDFNSDGSFKTVLYGNKSLSNFGTDVFTGYWQYGMGKIVPAKGNTDSFIEGAAGMTNFMGNLMNEMLK